MTSDGGMNPEMPWDAARLALGQVAELFMQEADRHTEIPPDELLAQLHLIDNYWLIPEPVRDAIEDLNYDDRRLLTGVLSTLADNHFYLEDRLGLPGGY